MNILFVNPDTGAGVEFIGNLFIEILRRVPAIRNIVVYKSQCRRQEKELVVDFYDLIIFNDLLIKDDQLRINTYKKANCPIINISHGGDVNHDSSIIHTVIDLNLPLTKSYYPDINYKSLNFTSGNIWQNLNRHRQNKLLYVSRIAPSKIHPEFLKLLRENNQQIELYGQAWSKEYLVDNSDVINYCGYVNHKELLDIYNNYRHLALYSITECLSMTIREAMLCGIRPVVLDTTGFAKSIEKYVQIVKDPTDFKFVDPLTDLEYKEVHKLLSFDRMIIDFLSIISKVISKNLIYKKNHYNNCWMEFGNIHQTDFSCYQTDTVDWQKINI